MDGLEPTINSIDLALDHPDLVTILEPTDVVVDHPDIIETPDPVTDIVSEHPAIALDSINLDVESEDLLFEHPKFVVEPENIEVEPNDLVLEHPKISHISTEVDVEPDEIALEHFKAAVGPKYVKVEPNDLVLEHPKIAKLDLDIEPNDLALSHPKVVNPIDVEPNYLAVEHPKIVSNKPGVDVEPDDVIIEHPKVAFRDREVKVEPLDLALEHPTVATNRPEIEIEPMDIALEHPKVGVRHDLDLEPNDVFFEHPKIVKRFSPVRVEPNFIATEHPKILKFPKGIKVEPADIAIEHPKVARDAKLFNVEPSDIVLEHPDLASSSDDIFSEVRNQKFRPTSSVKNIPTEQYNFEPETQTTNKSNMFTESGSKESLQSESLKMASVTKISNPKDATSKTMGDKSKHKYDDFKRYSAGAQKLAEEQIKQPGMDIEAIDIVPRRKWNAVEPRSEFTHPLPKPIKSVLATYTGTEACFEDIDCMRIIQNLQRTQMEEKNLPDIQWNYMIGGTGKVYEGRGIDTLATKPPHYEREAKDSLDIAYIGNNDEDEMHPGMFASLNGLIAWAMDNGHVTQPFTYLQDSPQYRKVLRLN